MAQRKLKVLVTGGAGLPELTHWVRSQIAADNVDEAAAELESRNLIR